MKKNGIKDGIKGTIINTISSDLIIPFFRFRKERVRPFHILVLNLKILNQI